MKTNSKVRELVQSVIGEGEAVVSLQSPDQGERHTVVGMTAKQIAALISKHTGHVAIYKGKATGEWHLTHKSTGKVHAIVYDK
jgi:hypothetical protein